MSPRQAVAKLRRAGWRQDADGHWHHEDRDEQLGMAVNIADAMRIESAHEAAQYDRSKRSPNRRGVSLRQLQRSLAKPFDKDKAKREKARDIAVREAMKAAHNKVQP